MDPSFHTRMKSREYPVYVGAGFLRRLHQILGQEMDRAFIVTDDIISKIHLKPVLESLRNLDIEFSTKILPPGESTKSLDRAQDLYRFLAENLASRSDTVLALGGGVIGDLAGFVASTYKRGMKLVQVPTTLLAQVDACLGGKTGVNLEWGKNLVGTFYQPHGIIADVDTLRTLSDDHYATGLAEVIKYGMIMDAKLFRLLVEKRNEIIQRNAETVTTIVERCLRNKARIVAQDVTDHGTRLILNFGHTVGHAIETCSNHSISHGEAVAIGMLEEARHAVNTDALDNQFLEELESLLCSFDLPTAIPSSLSKEDLKDAMKQDKKVRHGGLLLPVPVGLGKVEMKVVEGISI